MSELRKKHVCPARRLVIKVGTNMLAAPGSPLDEERVRAIADQVAWLIEDGRQVVLVSSGAIGCGMSELGMQRRPGALPLLQAAACVGQGKLIACYERHLRGHGLHAAQILLTREDFEGRERYLNACNAIHALIDLPCVPVVNENDAIITDEIKYGDNDILAAQVTHMIRAELLILLTSVPGLCAEPPDAHSMGTLVDVVERVDEGVVGLVYDETTPWGSGGMESKIEAARIATQAGEAALIADGRDPMILRKAFAGEAVGTLFLPASGRLRSYKRWLRFAGRPRGTLTVDEGARTALIERGKSLLPSGVTAVQGQFARGDVISVAGPDEKEFARGLSNYSGVEVERIKGLRSSQIKGVLGRKDYDEVIHRDNMALLE
jgi:glutamate 5-kinase